MQGSETQRNGFWAWQAARIDWGAQELLTSFVRGFVFCRFKHMLIPKGLRNKNTGLMHSKYNTVEI